MVFFEEFNDGHCSVEFKILRGFILLRGVLEFLAIKWMT